MNTRQHPWIVRDAATPSSGAIARVGMSDSAGTDLALVGGALLGGYLGYKYHPNLGIGSASAAAIGSAVGGVIVGGIVGVVLYGAVLAPILYPRSQS